MEVALDGDYRRVITPETPMNDEVEDVCSMINEMMNMRTKWLFKVWGGGRGGEGGGQVHRRCMHGVGGKARGRPLEH